MRKLLLLSFTCLSIYVFALGDIPQVPTNVEIAEMKLKITSGAQREIQKEINALRASEKYFRLKLDRINLYFPIIERVLKEEGVPEDIKFLSIQESALVSDAVSSSGAVGYWQFKDFTAREVGLRVDSKVDERKNIVASSRGAAKYFHRNNFYVKNWIYAVNAYMTGAGGVKPYVNQKDVGANSMVISEKTHWYVKRFIAHVLAFRDEVGGPHSEGMKLVEYDHGKNKSIEQIAHELKVDEDELKEYNKWLKFGKIPDDKTYTVIVPVKGRVPDNLKGHSGNPPLAKRIEEPSESSTKKDYKIDRKNVFIKRNGLKAVMATETDNVVSLAIKSNILSRQFLKYNDLRASETVNTGEIYYVQRKRNRAEIDFHVAQYDESLWEISQKYGVKMKKILKKNRMESARELKPGRKLWLRTNRPKDTPIEYVKIKRPAPARPKKAVSTPPKVDIPNEIVETPKPIAPAKEEPQIIEETESSTTLPNTENSSRSNTGATKAHVVQAGETFWSIAQKYNIPVNILRETNGLTSSSVISIGQELRISQGEASPQTTPDPAPPTTTPTQSSRKVHIVQPGESLWGISKKYEVKVEEIQSWNNLTPQSSLSIGLELIIQKKDEISQTVSSTSSTKNPTNYTVQPGDTYYSIAREFDLTVEELKSLNNKSTNELSVGEQLKVAP
ncbi:LysM peptidoglycan-binding domain-containing protein [Marinoscillum sp. MHG1-6]|uniref:LysM peptidoglycan-binding domain-containing protein n=1 Tax=Marinoscillum sp. MHG1-6 TaxID=2959627 RepID=UPI0021583BAA|nr:LysM peptidoglycan-binding domain-containing protein [Marinoscillum sp. MHG1-6]